MAGHTSEKRWRNNMNPNARDSGVSELAKQVCSQMINALTAAEAAFSEMQEIYAYAGGTVQGLADHLFQEDIAQRTTPGTNAVVTFNTDSGGSISAVSVASGSSGYIDGNYQLNNVNNLFGSIFYTVTNGEVSSVSVGDPGSGYVANATNLSVYNFPLAGPVPETTANADELEKAQDLFNAITALRELHQAASNVAVTQEDRYSQLRRMT